MVQAQGIISQPAGGDRHRELREPNVLIFTKGRNAERESLLFTLDSGPTEDASTRDLVHAGFIIGKNLDSVQAGDPDIANLQKLMRGRVDFIAVNPVSIAVAARKIGVDMKQLPQVVPVNQEGAGYWAAMNKGSDPSLVQKRHVSARKLETQGVFKAILEKYTH